MSGQQDDNWEDEGDPVERRKIQNRNSQRKFRAKERQEREESSRVANNQQVAGATYATANPRDLRGNSNPVGLPWGSVSVNMEHAVEAGRVREERPQ